MVVGFICLQASAMKWRAVRRLILILDASPSNSPLFIANALRMSCVLTGIWNDGWSSYPVVANGLCNLVGVFFRTVVSLGYAAHWSMKSKIFLVFAPIWQSSCTRNSSKVAEVIHELEFGVYLVGSFLLFWSSRVCCTCQSPVLVISLCHQHWILAEQWPSALIFFHHGKNHLCMSMSHWTGDYRRVQFHQH